MSDNGSTVLLLGAGASKASKYELPKMREFFEEELFEEFAPQPSQEKDKYTSLRRFLIEQYGMQKEAIV